MFPIKLQHHRHNDIAPVQTIARASWCTTLIEHSPMSNLISGNACCKIGHIGLDH